MAHFLRNEYGESGQAECESILDGEDEEIRCGAEPSYRCWGCDCWLCEEHTHFVGQESPKAKFCEPCFDRWGEEYLPREKRLAVA